MCLAVPMKVVEIEGNTARVEQSGVSKDVRVDFLRGVSVGDYVLVHAGIAIQRVNPEDAEETLRLMKAIADETNR